MFKKIIAIALLASAVFAFTGCSTISSLLGNGNNSNSSAQGTNPDGTENLKIGQKISTMFFDFTVVSATSTNEFSGILPEDGMQLIDIVITSTNTFGEEIEMYDADFQLQWGEGDEDYAVTLDSVDDALMAPLTYALGDGETMEFHYVYQAPADIKDFTIVYLEEYVEGDGTENTGTFYSVAFSV